jgi:cell wall-associated NlpC family hydrolase
MKTTKLPLLLPFFLLFSENLTSQVSSDWNQDLEILGKFLQSTPRSTVDSTVVHTALFFLNTPYVAHTLDTLDTEDLIINFREMDCLTFVENCLALSRTLRHSNPDMDCFERELRLIRYRDGLINTYASRLHYTSDWIFDNVKKGVIEDITHALGGKKFKPDVSFMSENYPKYKHLKDNPETVKEIETIEQEINRRENYYFIPKQNIGAHQALIKSGDIICFTTAIAGLDISHVGIAYRHKGQLTFIHASSTAKKVIINRESLADYCNKIKSNTGIIVLHPSSYNPDRTDE